MQTIRCLTHQPKIASLLEIRADTGDRLSPNDSQISNGRQALALSHFDTEASVTFLDDTAILFE